jgi:hypothetical protein
MPVGSCYVRRVLDETIHGTQLIPHSPVRLIKTSATLVLGNVAECLSEQI